MPLRQAAGYPVLAGITGLCHGQVTFAFRGYHHQDVSASTLPSPGSHPSRRHLQSKIAQGSLKSVVVERELVSHFHAANRTNFLCGTRQCLLFPEVLGACHRHLIYLSPRLSKREVDSFTPPSLALLSELRPTPGLALIFRNLGCRCSWRIATD